ncbi:hypothetical protein COU39_03370 [Candidatus Micrarchaeota archaeon CG10_big_fil_rev_8_21_14_0_10_60_32]|nr:MAG: hypothetical protein AUJ16_03640 [Candidatus Micrarchaeota archaeon CG1_02_60_51]PIN95934.1 MAG: hypothetical protein COU39_03370 [Candidatus Micrarchaeota archaeon CG10_big_fil_rev_8_21_14_0_10_60_32]PIO01841.1 MAG: hypothetical protein COT58_03070 [Candidatus Micrarchaeota archaeon CG09_land_8_20_14_0_10_60_16]
MNAKQAIAELRKHASKRNRDGMAAFGISTVGTLGVPVPVIRKMAKKIGKNHELATVALWAWKAFAKRY